MKIKVVYVIGSLQLGGAERALQKLVTNLPDEIEPTIITLFDLPNQTIADEMKNYRIVNLKIKNILDLPHAFFRIRKIIMKNDIVHGFMHHSNLITRFAAIGTDAKVISAVRVKELEKKKRNRMDVLSSFLVDKYTVNSKSVKKFICSYGIKTCKVKIIENAVDKIDKITPYEIKKYRKEFDLIHNWSIIVSEANLRKQKDIPITLLAIREIVKKQPTYYVHVGGGNKVENERDKLVKLTKRLGIEKYVRFAGFRDDARKIIQLGEVWTYSTLYEGQSNSLLQAMSEGLPIVCTNIEENCEVVGDSALLFIPKDYKKQAEMILKVLNDKKLAINLGKKAKLVSERYSLRNNINKNVQLYKELYVRH